MTVFEKLHAAQQNGTPVTLSRAEVELLFNMMGDQLAKAEAEFVRWSDMLREFERTSAKDENPQAG